MGHVASFPVSPPQSTNAFFTPETLMLAFLSLSLLPELRFGLGSVSMLGQKQQQMFAFESFCSQFETGV